MLQELDVPLIKFLLHGIYPVFILEDFIDLLGITFGYKANICYHLFWSGDDSFIHILNYIFNGMILLKYIGLSFIYRSTISSTFLFSSSVSKMILVLLSITSCVTCCSRIIDSSFYWMTISYWESSTMTFMDFIIDFVLLMNIWYALLFVEYPKKIHSSLLGSILRLCSLSTRI